MQKKFLRWLFLVVFCAFLLTFATSYLIQTNQSEKIAISLIKLKIDDAKNQLQITENNLNAIKQMTDKIALVKAKILAQYVYEQPKMLSSPNRLEKIKNLLDVDELHISDSKGILIASIPEKYKYFDMNSTEQTRVFMPALSNPNFEFVQEPKLRGYKDGIFQYAAVSRISIPGIIEIGFRPERLEEAQKLANIENISDGFRIGKSGSIIVIKNGVIISEGISNKALDEKEKQNLLEKSKNFNNAFKTKFGKTKYICVSEEWNDYVIVGILPESEMYLSRNFVVQALIFVNLILFVIIFFLIFLLLQKIVISGIWKVNASLNKITEGNLEEKVDVKNVEEFEQLSEGINSTVGALKNAIDAESKRLDGELELAKAIQHSALPNIFPPYPDHDEFEIFASMDPAKEVGGDFYDFFFISPDHLAFLIADVSGKGIPAALFMMTSKTLIKNLAKTGLTPSQLMTKVNKQICKTNAQGLFVTVFFSVLELSTGKLVSVNAGHNPPLIKCSNEDAKYFNCNSNIVVGVMNDVEYTSVETILAPGDYIFLYTDGVTEAADINEQFYGEERLQAKLNLLTSKEFSVESVLTNMRGDLEKFATGANQADDITMLILKYKGFKKNIEHSERSKTNQSSLSLPARVEEFPKVLKWLENLSEDAQIPEAEKTKLQIAVEEIFVNITNYAYASDDGQVEITFKVNNEKQVEMKFSDTGIPYNPMEKSDPDITLDIQDRPIGGLGVFMVKNLMDFVGYEFENNKNILTIKMNF